MTSGGYCCGVTVCGGRCDAGLDCDGTIGAGALPARAPLRCASTVMHQEMVVNQTKNERYALKPLGDVLPIIEAGGVFSYAKQAGMLK